MEWSRGWSAAAVLALAGVIVAVYLNMSTDAASEAIWLASAEQGETRLIGAALGVAFSHAVCFLAFVMFETNLIGHFAVILICAAWILKSYFLG